MAFSQLVVFDFDWSFADQDTDRWVLEVLAPDLRRSSKNLKAAAKSDEDLQWTDHMTAMLTELHKRGKTRQEIEESLQVMPFHPAMARAVRFLKETKNPDTTFLCLSNSNSVYISTILEKHGLTDIFTEIITNPAEWTPEGLLKIRRRVDPNGPQHTCKIGCSPNMCKGEELEAFITRSPKKFDRLVYVGDGSNDFCPILRMGRLVSSDIAYVRRYRGLEARIKKETEVGRVKVQVKPWAGAWEMEEHFHELAKNLPS
ncbi:hypothetical protein DL93DRAFT_2173054 [Clavulina sp. PMI_390]|nr:hypothetical protein DL93DRAFT_2173054 [Clavulina sp. PMI_390]